MRPAGFALPGFFPACFGILARAVAGYRGTLPVVTRNRHFAREAGITRIHHVDYQAKSYVGVYTIYTIIVYGD